MLALSAWVAELGALQLLLRKLHLSSLATAQPASSRKYDSCRREIINSQPRNAPVSDQGVSEGSDVQVCAGSSLELWAQGFE